MLRKGVSEEETIKRMNGPNKAFPDALVMNYEGLIPNLILPDSDDCHVLAAAIKADANLTSLPEAINLSLRYSPVYSPFLSVTHPL
ncbi:hypothetical protein GCM10023231_42550 [Olivibacter ginsenosidimutans]|uniref:Uncharacterized protein n=1 Tax=Olivibacter ginsenosidimutans TaxID=1176537 RepID=A0ABP9CDD6_9SPHI